MEQTNVATCHFRCKHHEGCVAWATPLEAKLGVITQCYLLRDGKEKYKRQKTAGPTIKLTVVEVVRCIVKDGTHDLLIHLFFM